MSTEGPSRATTTSVARKTNPSSPFSGRKRHHRQRSRGLPDRWLRGSLSRAVEATGTHREVIEAKATLRDPFILDGKSQQASPNKPSTTAPLRKAPAKQGSGTTAKPSVAAGNRS